jgi:hypothetical protein
MTAGMAQGLQQMMMLGLVGPRLEPRLGPLVATPFPLLRWKRIFYLINSSLAKVVLYAVRYNLYAVCYIKRLNSFLFYIRAPLLVLPFLLLILSLGR